MVPTFPSCICSFRMVYFSFSVFQYCALGAPNRFLKNNINEPSLHNAYAILHYLSIKYFSCTLFTLFIFRFFSAFRFSLYRAPYLKIYIYFAKTCRILQNYAEFCPIFFLNVMHKQWQEQ